jgi:deazaflavin-dependent oxidoreductase (nitroreductase family)
MWVGSNFLHYLDRLAIKLTKGKTSLSSIIAGVPIVMLTTTGALTGRLRSVPLIGLPDQDRFILVASSWGREKHPGWYYNLKKNPCATVSAQGWQKPYIAHLANDAEADVYWNKVIEIYPGYRVYRELAKKRKIGLFILEPEDGLSTTMK